MVVSIARLHPTERIRKTPAIVRTDAAKRPASASALILPETARKAFHASVGIFTVAYHHLFGASVWTCLVWLLPLALGFIAADAMRLRDARWNAVFCRVFGFLMRPSEKGATTAARLTASSFYFVGVLTVLMSAPNTETAILCILYLSWADTAAALVGKAVSAYNRRHSNRDHALVSTSILAAQGSATLMSLVGAPVLRMTWWEASLLVVQFARFGNRRGRRQALGVMQDLSVPKHSKSIAGSLAAFVCAFATTAVYTLLFHRSDAPSATLFAVLNAAFKISAVVALAEGLGGSALIGGVDDDLLVPVASLMGIRLLTRIPSFF